MVTFQLTSTDVKAGMHQLQRVFIQGELGVLPERQQTVATEKMKMMKACTFTLHPFIIQGPSGH